MGSLILIVIFLMIIPKQNVYKLEWEELSIRFFQII